MSTDTKKKETKQCTIQGIVRSAITYEQFQEALKIVNEYKKQLEDAKREMAGISKFAIVTKETPIFRTGISFRLLTILRRNADKLNIEWIDRGTTVKEIEGLSMIKLLQCRGLGKKTLQEFKDLCFYADIKLLP